MISTSNSEFTSRGWITDQLYYIGTTCAIVGHLTEKLEKIENELKGGNDFNLHKVDTIEALISGYNQDRREATAEIYALFPKDQVDEDVWCAFKHAIEAWQYATEVYYAKQDEVKKNRQRRAFSRLSAIFFLALGLNLTSCGSCAFDMLLAFQKDLENGNSQAKIPNS